jgi:hypothetical protein
MACYDRGTRGDATCHYFHFGHVAGLIWNLEASPQQSPSSNLNIDLFPLFFLVWSQAPSQHILELECELDGDMGFQLAE